VTELPSFLARPLPGADDACLFRALSMPAVARAPLSFRAVDDDFCVEEEPAYLPRGVGEHLYLHIEKRGLSTPLLLRALTVAFRVHERDVGIAGRKDERGVTRQWVSLPARAVAAVQAEGDTDALGARVAAAIDRPGARVTVLAANRHDNKLRLGHLRGNRFTVRIHGDVDHGALAARVEVVAAGVPALFGAQRFGPADDSLRQAERFLSRGRRATSRREEFLVSVAQASLFNAWLAQRVDDQCWTRPVLGDVLEKVPTGAPFVCTDPLVDSERAARREVVVAGPLLGSRMRTAERDAMTRESQVLVALGVDQAAALTHPALQVGARRPAVMWPRDLTTRAVENGVEVGFSLAKGNYASVVLAALFGPALADLALLDAGS
jgi:tRNA pseudouridine13 synthase